MTAIALPPEGKYQCKLHDQVVIFEASTSSICAAMFCEIVGGSAYEGFRFKHTVTLAKADGTLMTTNIDTLKRVFGWDGVDPFWLMDNSAEGGSMRGVEFEIVGGPETGDRGGTYFKSKWLNPLGGGSRTPVAADRRAVLAKYGSRFRAAAGVTTQGTGAEVRSAAPSAPPVPPAPRRPSAAVLSAQPSTMEDAWAALNHAYPGKSQAELEKVWYDTIAQLFPHKTHADLKPLEWAKVKAEFQDDIPM